MNEARECPDCRGRGAKGDRVCRPCAGIGVVRRPVTVPEVELDRDAEYELPTRPVRKQQKRRTVSMSPATYKMAVTLAEAIGCVHTTGAGRNPALAGTPNAAWCVELLIRAACRANGVGEPDEAALEADVARRQVAIDHAWLRREVDRALTGVVLL